MLASVLRTLVPLVVGALLALLARTGLEGTVDLDGLTELVALVVTAVYYAVVRWLEQRDARVGWLLGWAAPPTYPSLAEAARRAPATS